MQYKAELIEPDHSSAIVLAARRPVGVWQPGSFDSGHEPESDIQYRAVLRRHARSITAIMLGCVVASLLVTLMLSPSYKAKTLLEVLTVNPEFMNHKDLDPNAGASTADSYLETQTKLLTSETVADRVLTSLTQDPDRYKDEQKSGFAKLREWMGLGKSTSETLELQVRNTLRTVKVKAEGQSSLISITVFGPSPQIAADTANAIASQHIATLQDSRQATADQTTEFLGVQIEALRRKLQTSEDMLQAYARANGIIYTSDTSPESVVSEKLREIQADLAKAEADRADKQSQLELINSSSAETLPKVLDDASLRDNSSKLADLRRQLADLSATYTPNHYKVKQMESQIAALEKQSDQQRAAIVSRIRNDFKAASRREQLQKQAYEQQLGLVTNQSAKEVRYHLLKREVDANRDVYQSMLQKAKEATMIAALRASNIRVVDRAKAPTVPDQPNVYINTAIGVLVGCMLSVLFVLMRERGDRSIRTPGESARLLQLPELAIIPSARRDIRTQIVSNASRALRGPLLRRLPMPGSADCNDLLTNSLKSGSLVAEAFRSAVTSILLRGGEGSNAVKILVVTSAHPGAGKTTSVLNLGLGLAESGRRVLLIDGDLRLPSLGRVFGLEAASGLSDILTMRLAPNVARELICETSLPGLFVLPSGAPHRNAPQILHSPVLQALLEDVKASCDFILIDSPPAIPLTDARLLAQHADGVILVFKAGETSAAQSLSLRKCFSQDGTPVFGTILNNWNAAAEDPGYINSYVKYVG